MASHLLQIVETTATDLGHLILTQYAHRYLSELELQEFCGHFYNAMDLLNEQGSGRLMMPMRLAMAKVADSTFFWLMRHPGFLYMLNTSWLRIIPIISLDQAEYRRICSMGQDANQSIVPNETALQRLFDEVSRNEE